MAYQRGRGCSHHVSGSKLWNGTGPAGLVAKLDLVAVIGSPLIHLPFHSFTQPSHHSLVKFIHSSMSPIKHRSRQGPPGWEVSLSWAGKH